MNIIQTLSDELKRLLQGNLLYETYFPQWQYLLESYVGGQEYKDAQHLTRYQLETDKEYQARIKTTPLENHCQSVISVYNSFLFREEINRDFAGLELMPELEDFLNDADFDGRSLDAFMKDVATWSSVFGHCWIIVSKPNVGAVTVADEQALGVRPYVSLLTPMVVLDWQYTRQPSGRITLSYLRYLEETTGELQTVKTWTLDTITTSVIDTNKKVIKDQLEEVNGLGMIPAVCAYNGRSIMRGFGISDIADIADAQKFIYNATSEVEQSIRMDSHPSLVATPETKIGTGAGALIHMPENLDPGLKPYLLEFGGASVDKIYMAIKHSIDSIDKMANTGAVRATESRTMSGVAMETEFQLLNARLSEKADNLELAEEQMWRIWSAYMGTTWQGSVDYPGSFNIRDTGQEITQLKIAKETATNPEVLAKIDYHILEWMGYDDAEQILADSTSTLGSVDGAPPQGFNGASCPVATQDIGVNLANRQTAIDTANYGPLNPALPNTVFWMAKADMWNTDVVTAKQSLCGNCSFFDQTSKILDCIDQGLAAGGATGDEWDSVGGGQLGYCEAFDFKCKSTRTCDAWVAGGPITDA
jgi:hypothetical protein